MINETLNIIRRFAKEGVLHRNEVQNNFKLVKRFIYHGMVRKVHRDKKVFYELTAESLSILELMRKALLEEAKILAELHKPPSAFHALLDDVRFLDEKHDIAEQFKFLGDWQIKRPIVPSQLELAKLRYYQKLKGVRK